MILSTIKITNKNEAELRFPAMEVHEITENVKYVIQNIKDSLYFYNAAGLAANQIGYINNIFIGMIKGLPKIFINPVIVECSAETEGGYEGCFSVPHIFLPTYRPKTVTLKYQDENLEEHIEVFEGFEARLVIHEVEHLQGKLFIDGISQTKKDILLTKIKKLRREGKWDLDERVISKIAARQEDKDIPDYGESVNEAEAINQASA